MTRDLDLSRLEDGIVGVDGRELHGQAAIDLVMRECPHVLEGRKLRWARHAWAFHNLVAHPLLQLFHWAGATEMGLRIHDATVPRPTGFRPPQVRVRFPFGSAEAAHAVFRRYNEVTVTQVPVLFTVSGRGIDEPVPDDDPSAAIHDEDSYPPLFCVSTPRGRCYFRDRRDEEVEVFGDRTALEWIVTAMRTVPPLGQNADAWRLAGALREVLLAEVPE